MIFKGIILIDKFGIEEVSIVNEFDDREKFSVEEVFSFFVFYFFGFDFNLDFVKYICNIRKIVMKEGDVVIILFVI